MGLAQAKLSATEYLAWEALQTERHMFVAGEVFAMAGATKDHNDIAGNAYVEFKHHLKGTPCKTYIGDVRLHVAAADAYFYPDVVVTCDNADIVDPKASTIASPKLIVEVLSPSTAAYDRGQKFAAYRTLTSLQEYVLIDPELKTVEVFRKNAVGVWELHPSNSMDDIVTLKSVASNVKLRSFFE